MKIGIYGHSNAQPGHEEFLWTNLLKDHYQATVENYAVVHGSAERVLYSLKKTKDLNLAIIFHSPPHCLYVPNYLRDFDTFDKDALTKKMIQNWVHGVFDDESDRAMYKHVTPDMYNAWYRVPNALILELLSAASKNPGLMMDSDFMEKWTNAAPDSEKEYNLLHNFITNTSNKDKISEYVELLDCFSLYRKYFHNHDVYKNRYYGALLQIDQYLTNFNIPIIHCVGPNSWYPKWFSFQSGVINTTILPASKMLEYTSGGYNASSNGFNPDGNRFVFDTLLPLISVAQEKVTT
jgi:hypothetical protein